MSDGAQQLTDVGRSILDQSLSDIVSSLPNTPIVVEGYAEEGRPDQQYVSSGQRAIDVRQYLEPRFTSSRSR